MGIGKPIVTEDATTEDIVKDLGHNFDSVIISWGEDFTIEKE